MSEITGELVDTLKTEFDQIKKTTSSTDFEELMRWCRDEYKNYMLIGREQFRGTLEAILSSDYKNKKLFSILLENLDKFAAPKAFYIVSSSYENN